MSEELDIKKLELDNKQFDIDSNNRIRTILGLLKDNDKLNNVLEDLHIIRSIKDELYIIFSNYLKTKSNSYKLSQHHLEESFKKLELQKNLLEREK
tara:strand:+ start:294 stop:581 length:288 start_codon:yes stop_codon:yes gene_type:complete